MAKTTDRVISDLIEDVIATEGGQKVSNNPVDTGGPTVGGISSKWNPDAWKNGPPTADQQREIYMRKYVKGPGFDQIKDKTLQAQLVDYGVNSGPGVAIRKLQGILGVAQDGILGPETLAALAKCHPEDINNCLVAERIRMIGKIVHKNPSQVEFINGWLDRALQFLE